MNQIEIGSAPADSDPPLAAPAPVRARRILAIDPGSEHSGFVVYDAASRSVLLTEAEVPNADMLSKLRAARQSLVVDLLAIETFQPRGQPLYSQLIETARWTGRFVEAWGGPSVYVTRERAKMAVLGTTKGTDANVRAALIDAHGGQAAAVGTKAKRGAIYGVKSHAMAALAVAVAVVRGEGVAA